jgi:prepilin-type N-terminal cleavage/methylation domain-containing protein
MPRRLLVVPRRLVVVPRRLVVVPRDDDGVTLVEVMVAMVIMGFLMSMVTGAVIQIYHAVNAVSAQSQAQDQVNAAFIRLDKEIRYARGVSDPALVSGAYYVEYLISVDTVDTCVELRLDPTAAVLQRRQWIETSTTTAPGDWTTLADNVTGTAPFTVVPADLNALTGFRFQRLTLDIVSAVAGGNPNNPSSARAGATRETNVTFTALNATGSDNAATCTEYRSVS